MEEDENQGFKSAVGWNPAFVSHWLKDYILKVYNILAEIKI